MYSKNQGQISKKRCVESYCSFDKACQFSAACLAGFIWKNRQLATNIQSSLTFYASNDLRLQNNVLRRKNISYVIFKRCVCYICACLSCMSKREHS